mgnify:CR=1 FL=1
MAMIDDIMQQLQGMGLNTSGGFSELGQLDPNSIAQAMRAQFGLDSTQLPTTLFQGMPSSLIQGAMAKTYSPQIEATGSTLIDKMLTASGGQKGAQAAGGFAGSGQQQQYTSNIKDVYGKGMTDVLASTGQQRAQSLKSIQNMINQWQSQAIGVKYG